MAYMRYYRSMLTENEKKAYDEFIKGISCRKEKIELPYVNTDELDRIYYALNYDYPDFFYLDFLQYSYATTSQNVYIDIPYLMSFEEALRIKQKIDEKAAKIINAVQGMSELETEEYIHDALRKMAVYDTNTSHPLNAHNLIGPFLEGKCVCEGFAKAFKYLADMAKLKSIIVVGIGGAMGEEKEPHGWNLVRINGQNYHLDVTYDERSQNGYISRAYFNLSDLEILRDHTIDPKFKLPSCPKNMCPVPVISSTTDLVNYLRGEGSKRKKFTELRLTKRFTIDQVDQMILKKLTASDHNWYNRIKQYTLGNYSLIIEWY